MSLVADLWQKFIQQQYLCTAGGTGIVASNLKWMHHKADYPENGANKQHTGEALKHTIAMECRSSHEKVQRRPAVVVQVFLEDMLQEEPPRKPA